MKFHRLLIFCALFATILAQDANENNDEKVSEVKKSEAVQDSEASGTASHSTAYNSIISHYYSNDPYFGSPRPGPSKQNSGAGSSSSSSRSQDSSALTKLKRLIAVKRKRLVGSASSSSSSRRTRIKSPTREMIPAPLFAGMNARFVEDIDELTERKDSTSGIPAPLLVGGAYKSDKPIVKKTLEVEHRTLDNGIEIEDERPPRLRLHLKKKRKTSFEEFEPVDKNQERSVFSELISVRNPAEAVEVGVDSGLRSQQQQQEEEEDEGRGFFDDDIDDGFRFVNNGNPGNPGRPLRPGVFPGDEREDIPTLPEIENPFNREPEVRTRFSPRQGPYPYFHDQFDNPFNGHHESGYGRPPPPGPPQKRNTPPVESKTYFDIMDDFFDEPEINIFPEGRAAPPPPPQTRVPPPPSFVPRQPVKRNPEPYGYEGGPPPKKGAESFSHAPTPYGHAYSKPMSYMNPMDKFHNPSEVDVFTAPAPPGPGPRSGESLFKQPRFNDEFAFEEPGVDDFQPSGNFFVDIPKININQAIGSKAPSGDFRNMPENLPNPQPLVQSGYYDNRPRQHYEPEVPPQQHFSHRPDIQGALDEVPDHSPPPYQPPASSLNSVPGRYEQYDDYDYKPRSYRPRPPPPPPQPKHSYTPSRSYKPKNFPSYDELTPKGDPFENTRYVEDMPHLPPPPEMLEMQRNSLFPVDVPKIGSKVAYEPPEVLFNELHKHRPEDRVPFKREIKTKPKVQHYQPPNPTRHHKYNHNIDEVHEHKDKYHYDYHQDQRPQERYSTTTYRPIEETSSEDYWTPYSPDHQEVEPEQQYTTTTVRSRPKYEYVEDNHEKEVEEVTEYPKLIIKDKYIPEPSGRQHPYDFSDYSRPPPKEREYENEAIEETTPPVYVPKTTYKYENDYQEELPLRSESQESHDPVRRLYNAGQSYVDQPDYYLYDPMAFKKDHDNYEPETRRSDDIEDFPPLPPFSIEETQFQSRSLDFDDFEDSRGRSSNRHYYGRALHLSPGGGERFPRQALSPPPEIGPRPGPPYGHTPIHGEPVYPVSNSLEPSHQFIHVDDIDTYKAGHNSGNPHHNIKNIKEHQGPHHIEEVSWKDSYEGYGKHYFEYNHDYRGYPGAAPPPQGRRPQGPPPPGPEGRPQFPPQGPPPPLV